MDLENYLPDIVIQWQDAKDKSYKEILSELAQQMLANDFEKTDFTKIKSNFFIEDLEFELTNKLQSIVYTPEGSSRYDENWMCTIGKISQLKTKRIGLTILNEKTNLGPNAREIQFLLLVLSPIHEKKTKNNFETALTFASLLCDKRLRHELLKCKTREEVIRHIALEWQKLIEEYSHKQPEQYENPYFDKDHFLKPAKGLINDFKLRLPVYLDDYLDGLRNFETINKVFSTILLLYFSVLMPAIAYGVYFETSTDKKIGIILFFCLV